jgi:hypothetical protein
VGIDKKSVKKMFPHLAKELEGGSNKVRIDSVRENSDKAEAAVAGSETQIPTTAKVGNQDSFRHYNPSVVDFIRRCDTLVQAEEIICYLLKRGEMTKESAGQIREQLKR